VSLYIVTQPNDKARLRPLVRVMVNMIVRLLADKMDFENGRPVAHYKHRLLMMLDEFPSLGKLEIMQESLAFVAGYGIKCYLICQDINQLKSRETGYGHDETITSNCHVQNAYPPNRVETAEHLSRLTGQTTVVKEQITTSGRRTAAMLGQVSRTLPGSAAALADARRVPCGCRGRRRTQRARSKKPATWLIYVAGYPAIYGKQPLYFKDPVFPGARLDPRAEGQRSRLSRPRRQGRASRYEPHPETHRGTASCHRRRWPPCVLAAGWLCRRCPHQHHQEHSGRPVLDEQRAGGEGAPTSSSARRKSACSMTPRKGATSGPASAPAATAT
jgi:hypothetical protein